MTRMATNSVSVQYRSIPLQLQCWRAFVERDYNEAIRLLPLVEEPKEIDLRGYLLRLLLVELGVC